MTARAQSALVASVLVSGTLLLASAPVALGHGGEEASGGMSTQSEMADLAKQPARVLAQQAIALLQVRGDKQEAAVRLDAALESNDKSNIDVAVLRQATETLDSGDPQGAIPLLDRALSRPLGAASGKSLHEAEQSFEPADTTQDVVAIAAGAAFLLLGAAGLWLARRRVRTQ